jgi:nuclear GTP-binding protein
MGSGKKEANRKERQGKTGDGMGNVKVKGENFYRYAHADGDYVAGG